MKWIGCILLYLLVHLQDPVPVSSHRNRHSKRRGEISAPFTHTSTASEGFKSNPKRAACAVRLPANCSCLKTSGSLSIKCSQAELTAIPTLNVGASLVTTLNLERNQLSSIKIGSFFGIKIERLLLSNNSISDLDFLAFWGLEFHLKTLDLSCNFFKQVPSSSLRPLRNLRSLILNGNKITSLRDYDFGYLRTLEVLALDNNPIAAIAPKAFDGTQMGLLTLNSIDLREGLDSFPSGSLKLLKGLSLANNRLTHFPTEWFNNLKSLQYLSLDSNKLFHLPAEAFVGIGDTLQKLELNSNRFRKIPKDVLQNLPNLRTLEMNDNCIKKIFSKIFNTSTNLQTLGLSNNDIDKISIRGFDGLDNIQSIDLRNNKLITLDDRSFYWKDANGRQIRLANNPLLCNCLLKWLKRELKRKTDLSKMFVDAKFMICQKPRSLSGKAVKRVHLKDFTCDHDYFYYYQIQETDVGGEEKESDLGDFDPAEYDNFYDYDEEYDNYGDYEEEAEDDNKAEVSES